MSLASCRVVDDIPAAREVGQEVRKGPFGLVTGAGDCALGDGCRSIESKTRVVHLDPHVAATVFDFHGPSGSSRRSGVDFDGASRTTAATRAAVLTSTSALLCQTMVSVVAVGAASAAPATLAREC